MFRFDIVSGRDKRALVPIVIISNIKDSSSLLGNVLGLNIWYIFCDQYCIRVANLRKLSEMTNISFVKVRSHQLIDLHFGLVRIKSAQKRINTAQTTSEPLFRMLKERLKSKKE